jgi:hypothetical protein
MPGINIGRPLLGAGAAAKNDWASASARTGLDFSAQAEFRRGINVTIGLEALATADAGLSRFISATVRGNAFASAEAGLQIGLPLNLFKRFGLTVGAEATAQAAAGLEAGLALSIGDFIELVRRDPDAVGVPLELILLLFEEVEAGGIVKVHVAAAAMAYASLQIAGAVIDTPAKPAGFEYTIDAGLGLAAGMGFSGGLLLGFKDFRRFYGRAVDLAIGTTVDQVASSLPAGDAAKQALAGAFAPVAKIALRCAYEIGSFIEVNKPDASNLASLSLANHCVGLVLEESQRYLLDRFVAAGLGAIHDALRAQSAGMSPRAWNGLRPQRLALAQALYSVPPEPFQPTSENAAFWRRLQQKAASLVDALPAGSPARDQVMQGLACAAAAAELLTEMFRSRINQAQAYVVAVGVGRIATQPSFGGPLPSQPPARVKGFINSALGLAASADLDTAALAAFLGRSTMLDALRGACPDVDEFARIFRGPVAALEADVLAALLANRQAFLADAAGDIDPKQTLTVLLDALDAFIADRLDVELKQAFYQTNPDPTARLYFDDVLLGAINFTKDVAFRTVLDWETRPLDRDSFTEALASVLTMMLGRSLVIVGDLFFNELLENIEDAAAHASSRLSGGRDPFRAIGIATSPELRALFADTLRIGGEVFGPLPDDTRSRVRQILYEIMEPLPPTEQQDFVDELADQFFIPNREHLAELSEELLAISRDRFGLFVEKVLESAGQALLDAIVDFIEQAIQTIKDWERQLGAAIADLGRRLQQLEQEIARLVEQVEEAFSDAAAAIDQLLDTLRSNSARSAIKAEIVSVLYSRAQSVLLDNELYKALPREFRRAVRSLLKDTIRGLVGNPLVDPVLDAVTAVAGELETVIDDIRDLDPSRPLSEQLLDLVADRIEDGIRDHFGSSDPRVGIGFNFSYEFFGHHSVRFELGQVRIPISSLFGAMRDAIDDIGAFDSALTEAAGLVAAAFEKLLELQEKEEERTVARSARERLGRIDREHTSSPKEIAILSPAPSSVHQGSVPVEIHLGGVPPSYLGLDRDEQQRVFIFLNGDLIPSKSLVVGRAAGAADRELHRLDFTLTGLAAFDADAQEFRGSDATIRLRGGGGAPAGGAVALNRSESPHIERRTVPKGSGARSITSTEMAGVRPGRTLAGSQIANLRSALPAGTEISFDLGLSELVQGANTLTVVVIDRGGRQYQQVVSFGVAAPPRLRADDLRPRLPDGVGRAFSRGRGRPAKPPVGVSAAAADLRARLRKASSYLESQARLNLTDFTGDR